MVYRRTSIRTSPIVESSAEFIRKLATARSVQRRKRLIGTATSPQLLALVEIAVNLLRGRIPIRANHKQRLGAQATNIRRLSRVRSDKTARKVLLGSEHQNGGGPLAIAGLISRLLLPFITELI